METVTDLIFAAILIFCVISGFRRGLIRSLVNFVGGIAALVAAVKYSPAAIRWTLSFLGASAPSWMHHEVPSKIAAVLILFILFDLLIHLIAAVLDRIFQLPILRQINALFGGIFGFCKGAVIVLILCAVLRVSLPMKILPGNMQKPVQRVVYSRIYQTVSNFNPVYNLFQSELFNEVGRNEKTKQE